MIDPGKFTERVQILAPTNTQGASGEAIITWGDYGTRWAKVELLGGTELTKSDVILPLSRAKFTFRYNEDITEAYRLVWNGQTWDISNINVVGRKAFLEIMADSNSMQDAAAGAYPAYYNTETSKIRVVTGTAVVNGMPSQANIDSDVGLTAAAAGVGYVCGIDYTESGTLYQMFVISDGTYWFIYTASNYF
jgi:SPP1 family predicted phage head-tail adaptor